MCKAWVHSLSFSSSPSILFDHPRIIILMNPRSNPSSPLLLIFITSQPEQLQFTSWTGLWRPRRNSEYIKMPWRIGLKRIFLTPLPRNPDSKDWVLDLGTCIRKFIRRCWATLGHGVGGLCCTLILSVFNSFFQAVRKRPTQWKCPLPIIPSCPLTLGPIGQEGFWNLTEDLVGKKTKYNTKQTNKQKIIISVGKDQ